MRLAPASVAGGLIGAVLLLVLPSSIFKRVVIVLIVIALVLVVLQPRLAGFSTGRTGPPNAAEVRPALLILVAATGVYGGYFGAAQGIVLIAILGLLVRDDLQRLNATKNVLAGTVNLVASIVFIFATTVDWKVAGLIAAGSIIGGQLGAHYGRRLDPRALRFVIVVVGTVALVRLVRS